MSGFEGMRCGDPLIMDIFTSDNPHERQKAQRICDTCPALRACEAYAGTVPDKFGVWHGVHYANNKPTLNGRCAHCGGPISAGQSRGRYCGRLCADIAITAFLERKRGSAA